VVALPSQTPLGAGRQFVDEGRKLLEKARQIGEKHDIPVSFNILISHKIHHALLEAQESFDAQVMLLGLWVTPRSRKVLGRVLDPVLQMAPCDIGIMKPAPIGKLKNILVPTAGGPHARLALNWALWLAEPQSGTATLLYILPPGRSEQEAHKRFAQTREGISEGKGRIKEKIIHAEHVLSAILEESKSYDLVIVGASNQGFWQRVTVGTLPEKLSRHIHTPLIVVRRFEGRVLSWLRRLLTG
jgi:nucleotide-binding universal stress UspA family protein